MMLAKEDREHGLILEPQGRRHLLNRGVGVEQEVFGLRQSPGCDALVDGQSGLPLEQAIEMALAHAELLHKPRLRSWFVHVMLDKSFYRHDSILVRACGNSWRGAPLLGE